MRSAFGPTFTNRYEWHPGVYQIQKKPHMGNLSVYGEQSLRPLPTGAQDAILPT
jgi:hypothetical protein